MEKLKFPIIKGAMPGTKILSSEDYLRFVYFNMRYTFNKETYKETKRKVVVNKPFVIK